MACSSKHDGGLIDSQPERVESVVVDDQIAAFCTTFKNFRKDFDSRVLLTTALFLPRMVSSIDMTGACSYTVRYLRCLMVCA